MNNVIRLKDLFDDSLVLEFIPGETLEDNIKGLFLAASNYSERCRRIQDVAIALTHVHRKGYIHRDIKPENILIDDRTDTSVLIDFGLSQKLSFVQPSRKRGACVVVTGTPAYMAPEEISKDHPITTAYEIYGLGVALYRTITTAYPR